MKNLMLKNGSKEKHFRGKLQSLTILSVLLHESDVSFFVSKKNGHGTIQHDIDIYDDSFSKKFRQT